MNIFFILLSYLISYTFYFSLCLSFLHVYKLAGIVSVVGYEKITPWLSSCIGLDDTCGVHNLHGMPGVLGALAGALSASMAGDTAYGASIGSVFPQRASSNATIAAIMGVNAGSDRTASEQVRNTLGNLHISCCL